MQRRPAIVVDLPLVVTASSAYVSGYQLGSLMTISKAMLEGKAACRLLSVTVIDKDKQDKAIDLYFFSDVPTVASVDHAAADVSDTEVAAKCLGVISIPSANYADLANSSVATLGGLGLVLQGTAKGAQDLYVLAVTRSTPTYTSTSALRLRLGLEQY